MRRLALLAAGATLLVGCGAPDKGELPPPPKPLTQAQIDSMPPEARAQVQGMQKYSQSMAAQAAQRAAAARQGR